MADPGRNAVNVVTGEGARIVEEDRNPNMVDGLDRAELAADFGTSYGVGLVLATPDLLVLAYQSQGYKDAYWDPETNRVVKGKFYKNEEWDPTRIANAIQNTDWYKNLDGNARLADNARYSDPASWERQLKDVENAIYRTATKIGADLTGTDVGQLAFRILRNNYTYLGNIGPGVEFPDHIINAFLTPLIKANADGTFSGAAGMNAATVRQLARDYGVPVTDNWIMTAVQGLQSGSMTEADIRRQIVQNSQSTWAGLAGNINETTSVKDLASSYIQTMANTWEMDPETISLDTPEIKKALTYIDPSTGKPRQKTVWEFEQELRKDPRWDRTQRGMKELTDAGMAMLRDFGFWK